MEIKSIKKAFDILRTVAGCQQPASLTELSHALSVPASTLHHILRVLRQEGFLHQDHQSRRYSLGYQALILGEAARRQMALVGLAVPLMDDLVRRCGETVTLGVLENDDSVLYIVQRDGTGAMRMNAHPGSRGVLHATASGKLFLAHGDPPDPLTRLPSPLASFTPNTITELADLAKELSLIRRQGYAIDREERELGMVCVAAPILNAAGRVESSLAISGPTSRMTGTLLQERIEALGQASDAISRQLGYR